MAHILIVEDEQSINDLISMNLELVGHSSEQVFDGNEALVCLKQNSYSLIIMDIMLPGLDGFNLIPMWIRVLRSFSCTFFKMDMTEAWIKRSISKKICRNSHSIY